MASLDEILAELGCGPEPKAMVGGAYEGADRFDRTLAAWQPPLVSADRAILYDKPEAEGRALDMLRNDSYVRGASDIHRDSIVGSAFLLNAKPMSNVLFGATDETWEEEFQEEVETKFNLIAESVEAWLDASRTMTLTGLVRMAVASFIPHGETLATAEWLRDGMRPCSTAVQMIDVARLSNSMGQADTAFLRGGIERDRYGRPINYHIRVGHPGDYYAYENSRLFATSYLWKVVPARKPWGRKQVIHIYDPERPDQTRGIGAMVSALKEMRITKKFRDIVLQNAVVNATFAASIESELPSEAVFTALGGGNINEDTLKKAIADYGTGYLQAIAQYMGNSRNSFLDGVKVPHLFPGTKLQLRPAGQGGPLGTDFEMSLLRYIAASLGVSYEQLSRDYTQTNYSSARAAMNETWKHMQARKRVVADRFATEVYRLWLEEALNKGQLETAKGNRDLTALWYENPLYADAISACDWIGASRGQIDELKETQAAVLRRKNNLSTDEYELARLGLDWRNVYRQAAREKALRKQLGIQTVDEIGNDNMMNAASGAVDDGGDGNA